MKGTILFSYKTGWVGAMHLLKYKKMCPNLSRVFLKSTLYPSFLSAGKEWKTKVEGGGEVVVVALLFYVHGKHLRSCRDGQLT